MKTEHPEAASNAGPHGLHEPGEDAALLAALAELRVDRVPERALWSGIEARIRMPAPLPMNLDERRPAVLSELRTDASPARDFWPQIQARIRQQRWRRLRTPLAAAAGLAASLVVVLGLQVSLRSESSSTQLARAPLHPSAQVLAAMQEPVPDTALHTVSTQPLAPETRALMRANLKIVANAEAQLRRAMANDPDAEYLESLLVTAQQQKEGLRQALAKQH